VIYLKANSPITVAGAAPTYGNSTFGFPFHPISGNLARINICSAANKKATANMGAGSITLILGGARSGKSSFAQRTAESLNGDLVFVATAQALDNEMTARIAQHRADRDQRWQTLECPIELADAISGQDGARRILLVDCLTLWLSNLMLNEVDLPQAMAHLEHVLIHSIGHIILVSNEVGQGIVPANALARRFRDEAGRLNQRMAALANDVWFVTAGLPVRLKG
jgi:adenosylcobinamide kinase / adenosylcobinamide-phosphate guanylyltransferase